MLFFNAENTNIIPNTYTNRNNNFRSLTKNLSSVSRSSTNDNASNKINQLIRSGSENTTKVVQNTENSTSSSETDNSSTGKINDQVSMTKSSGSGELTLYTALAKLKGSNNSQSENSTENTNKNENNNLADELETSTTSSSPVNLAGQMKEMIITLSKAREDLDTQRGGNSGRMENSRQALLAYEDNLRSTESYIRDMDMTHEATTISKYQSLTTMSNAMLGQANQIDNNHLRLLG